jgi:hypothetical protein
VVAALGLAVCELQGSTRRFVAVGAGILVLLYALAHLRDQSAVVAAWAMAAAFLIGRGPDHRRRAVFGVAVLVILPSWFGYGFGGAHFIGTASETLEERRSGNEVGAASALTCDKGRGGLSGKIEHLPCGFPAVVLRPYPWESDSSTSVRLARLEALLWYPLLALSLFGLTRGWTLRRVLAFPALYGGGIIVVYALTEGNVGTAFRHRAEAMWAVALFAALGAQTIADRRARSAPPRDAESHAGTLIP